MLAGLIRNAPADQRHRIHTLMPADDFFGLDPALISSGSGRRGRPGLRMAAEVRAAVRSAQADIVHAWMYHANLASVAAVGLGASVVWSIHNAALTATNAKRATRLADWACATLSGIYPRRIVYVTDTVRRAHEESGYARKAGRVIANGVDLGRFALPSDATRRERGTTINVLMIGRFDPVKGHDVLLEAIAGLPERARVHLTLAGRDCQASERLRQLIEGAGLRHQCTVLDAVAAVERLYAAADIVVLPSREEAFPMALLEAAAIGRVICASAVGEIGALGLQPPFLFAPGDVAGCCASLSAAIAEVDRPSGVGSANRAIAERFSLARAVNAYADLYRELAQSPGQ